MFMKILFLTLVYLFAFNLSVVAQSDIKLEIGAKLPRKYISSEPRTIAFNTNDSSPYTDVTINDVDYTIAYREKTRKIVYIHTTDKDFHTVNGLQVGLEIAVSYKQLDICPSWEIRAPATQDGWFPVVGIDLPHFGGDYVARFKDDEVFSVSIGGFSKGGN